jgi:dTDP-glucose 4,6-dehydratase
LVEFKDGMRRTVEWYLDNKAWIASVTDGSYREYYEKMYGNR